MSRVPAALRRRDVPAELSSGQLPRHVAEALETPAQELDSTTRSAMDSHFGYDLSRVRVHTDAAAAESSNRFAARAYTVGSHIVFAQGQYAPDTPGGARLIAHELEHVDEQSTTPASLDVQLAGAEVGEDWSKQSREVAERAEQVFDGLADISERIDKITGGKHEVSTWTERFKTISKQIALSRKIFDKTTRLIQLILKLSDMVDEFNAIDLQKDPQRGAELLDRLFGQAGDLLDQAPAGPWREFSGLLHECAAQHFFRGMQASIAAHFQRVEEAYAGRPGTGSGVAAAPARVPQVSEPGVTSRTETSPAAPLTLEGLLRSIDQKVTQAQPALAVPRGEAYAQLVDEYQKLSDQVGEWQKENSRFFTRSRLHDLEKQIPNTALEVMDALKRLGDTMPGQPLIEEMGILESFQLAPASWRVHR